jgi:hypothetical protein
VPRRNTLGLRIYTSKKKMKVRRVKRVFSRGGSVGGRWEGAYGGCVLYPYMKIEE